MAFFLCRGGAFSDCVISPYLMNGYQICYRGTTRVRFWIVVRVSWRNLISLSPPVANQTHFSLKSIVDCPYCFFQVLFDNNLPTHKPLLLLYVCYRRAARAVGGVRGRGEAGARLLADQREPHQILLLEKLPLLHREQTYTGLVQQEHSQTTNEYKHGRHAGLGAVQD